MRQANAKTDVLFLLRIYVSAEHKRLTEYLDIAFSLN